MPSWKTALSVITNVHSLASSEALHVCEWCFGPLEVVYDYDGIAAATTRESIAAGPPSIWRYAQLLPVALLAVREFWRRGEVDIPSGLGIALGLVFGTLLGAMLAGLFYAWLAGDDGVPEQEPVVGEAASTTVVEVVET